MPADDGRGLQADVAFVPAPDPMTGLDRLARARRATRIVLPHQSMTGLRHRLQPSLADQLLEREPGVEVQRVGRPPKWPA
jgi:K+-sensing histidine kinase KdpD